MDPAGQMRKARRAALLAALMLVGGGAAFLLGVLSVSRGGDALYLVLLLTVSAAVVRLAVRLVLGGEPNLTLSLAVGVVLFPVLLSAFVLGIFAPYVGGWGDRQLDQFGGNDINWRPWLSFLLIAAGVSGALFGATVGFLSWALGSARLSSRRRG